MMITVRNREVTTTGFPYGGSEKFEIAHEVVTALGKLSSWGDAVPRFWLRLDDGREVSVKACDQLPEVEKWIRRIAKRQRAAGAPRFGWAWIWIPVEHEGRDKIAT
jgi:hypothetical protein